MKKRQIIILAAFLILVFVPRLASFFADWIWFRQVGFENIFTTMLGTKITLGLLAGLFTFGFIYLNLKLACRLTRGLPVAVELEEKNIERFSLFFSLVIGFFAGLGESSQWGVILRFLNPTSFGVQDPIFGRDLAFYFFTLPFWEMLSRIVLLVTFISLMGATLIYFVRGAVFSFFQKQRFDSQGRKDLRPKNHLFGLLAFLFSVLALQTYFIKIPNLLYSDRGPFTGANYTDVNVVLPVLKITSFVLAFAALASVFCIFRRKYRFLFFAFAAYLVVAVLGGGLLPLLLQKFIVEPNELVKETPYITHNISGTQQAYGLDKVEERNLEGEASLTMEDIKENEVTIKNIRLWDRKPLLDTFGQIQEIRTYYDFVSIDNDRYVIDGEYRQVLLSPRELNSSNLPNPNFINKHLTFTHGFGLTLGPVNEVTEEGLPVLFIKDLPPVSEKESLQVERPEIYYGEIPDQYVVANTESQEFDYPAGEENVYSDYQGSGGVPVDSFWKKIVFALKFGEPKLLLSQDIEKDSRIMYHRDIQERARKVLPFLEMDKDPYLVLDSSGSLKWIYDAYTTGNHYPYSQKINRGLGNSINYIRNSVKVVINAYDGSMQFYIADPKDPLIQTYAKIFKGSFLPLEQMPQDLKAHLRYPEDIFKIQTALYTVYHMERPQIFYNKEDQWQIPRVSESKGDPMVRHIIMKLPGEEQEEFILMIPFTPKNKDNLSAWMVARSDGENYGELMVYRFPKQRLVFGPRQIINRINQNPEISRQISLWDQRGSQVNLGSLLVIPIEESLLYVRPLYLRAQGSKIPELKRVIVAYEKRISMEETLDRALEMVFSDSPPQQGEQEPVQKDLISQAKTHLQNALEAQRQGNWTLYGQEIEKLEEILQQIE